LPLQPPKKPNKIHLIIQMITTGRKITVAIVVMSIALGGYFAWMIYNNLTQYSDFDQVADQEIKSYQVARLIDGVLVTPGATSSTPYAVMIENEATSRPAAGLSRANLVYEALAESSITRFVAFFDPSVSSDRIGPVRSARPYYVSLAGEWGALYAHSGGSPEAIDLLESTDRVYDLNEFYGINTQYFWRRPDRYSPHNLYTSSERLNKAASTQLVATTTSARAWLFKDDASEDQRPTETKYLIIDYSGSSLYRVEWRYRRADNDYERWQDGAPHQDEDDSQIRAKNVVVQYVSTTVLDAIGRRSMDLTGTGKALIIQDGKVIVGSWRRDKAEDRTIYYDNESKEVSFNRGVTWVQIVPEDMVVKY